MDKRELTLLNMAYELQKKMVKTVIDFCNENDLTNVDEVTFNIDSLKWSLTYGDWHPGSDSVLIFRDENGNKIAESL